MYKFLFESYVLPTNNIWTTIHIIWRLIEMTIPTWVLFIVVGIIFSAIMTVKTAKEENRIESEQIEKAGEIYMARLKKEKMRKKQQTS